MEWGFLFYFSLSVFNIFLERCTLVHSGEYTIMSDMIFYKTYILLKKILHKEFDGKCETK